MRFVSRPRKASELRQRLSFRIGLYQSLVIGPDAL